MSSEIHGLKINEILYRVAKVINSDKNVDIANALDVAASRCSNWKSSKRQTIPWIELFNFCRKNAVSFDWLLTGKTMGAASMAFGFSDKAIKAYSHILERIISEVNQLAVKEISELAVLNFLSHCINAEREIFEDIKKPKTQKKTSFS